MIASSTLRYLAGQKQKDALALFKLKRHSAAVYIMGYALELSLKAKISYTLNFINGFPESPNEFASYNKQIAAFNNLSVGIALTQLRQIKSHNLNQLLAFSGADYRIKNQCLADWLTVSNWTPENRYRIQRYTSQKTKVFIRAALTILKEIV